VNKKLWKKLTANIGGTRYEFDNKGSLKRLGSEEMDYRSAKIVGSITDYGRGNRHITKNNIDISLKDIFNDPNRFVGTYPIYSMDGRLGILSGGKGSKELDHQVLWIK